MSFFNKIWKNIRDKKDPHSLDIQTAKSSTLSTHHQPLGQKGKSFYKRIDQLIHQSESEVKESKNEGVKESKNEGVKESKNEEVKESKNEASSSGIENAENISPNQESGIMTMSDDDEVILPPGIVTEMVRSKNQVSRHVSVSRSGRYKQKHRKRSNLFDVVSSSSTDDGNKKESSTSNGIIASNDVDMSSRKKLPPSVMATSLSLSPGFDSNDFKSIEQDCDRTVIEVQVMTTSQSLLSSQAKDSILPLSSQAKDSSSNPSSIPSFNQTGKISHSNQSKEGITINPSFITFPKHSDSNTHILPHFNYNNNSNPINFGQEAIKL